MLNYYQTDIKPFLKSQKNRLPSGVSFYYYHSFEDALWHLVQNKFPEKKLKFLVPDFYCSDVLDNLRRHGHDYVYYPLDDHFQISPSAFRRYLWLFQPDVVIIFHACGVKSQLFSDTTWLADFPKHSLIIEDSVQRLVDPCDLYFLSNRHFVIDSLRKVSPFPGSRLFGRSASLNFPPPGKNFFSSYFIFSSLSFLLFRLVFLLGMHFKSFWLVTFAHTKILRFHDDIIGDSYRPHAGNPFWLFHISRIDYKKVFHLKNWQSLQYSRILSVNWPAPSEFGYLHAFPLVVSKKTTSHIDILLRTSRIPVWFKFTDSPWSQKRAVLFLPLGFHISEQDIRLVCELIKSS